MYIKSFSECNNANGFKNIVKRSSQQFVINYFYFKLNINMLLALNINFKK